MLEKLHERVSVLAVYNNRGTPLTIYKVKWNGRVYPITQLGYPYKRKVGKTTVHVFHVNNDTIAFKLEYNSEWLTWHVVEVSDGLAD
jgi:hypothetical protein